MSDIEEARNIIQKLVGTLAPHNKREIERDIRMFGEIQEGSKQDLFKIERAREFLRETE